MHRSATSTILSPSDLVTHLACGHATELDRRVLAGELARPGGHDPDLEVPRRRGDEHERDQLAQFKIAGLSVVEIRCAGSGVADLLAAEADTLAAMQAGVDVVFQATFFDGRWRGHADFLLRTELSSDLGPWSYEVADSKLARRVKPSALVQLCSYAEQVARLQGVVPAELVVITGDGVHHRHRTADVAAFHRLVKGRFEAVVDGELEPTDAVPVEHCGVCPWAPRCEEGWRIGDDLRLIAGVGGGAAATLSAAGITNGALLAASTDGQPVEGMQLEVADRLRRQARLQLAQRGDGVVRHELLAPEATAGPSDPPGGATPGTPPPPARGLAALPAPSPGDLFFDIEGDPWVGGHGIEYLFGVVDAPTGAQSVPRYSAFWGHDPAGERRAFEQLVDLVMERLEADPGMHVFHYAAYERSVLQRLAGRYDTRQAEVDRILRGKVLVDLYQVVRHAVLVSQEGYGLKKLEPLYLPVDARSGEAVTDGGSSIAVYEEWLESRDPARLEEIRAYNEVDCRSTLGLRDWLEARRVDLALRTGSPVPRPEPVESKASAAVVAADDRQEAAAAALLAEVPDDGDARTPDDCARQLLADLLGWHRREERPGWWEWFDRRAKDDAGLVADREAVGGLVHLGELDGQDRPDVHHYAFDPAQDHKLPLGKDVHDPRTGRSAGRLVALDVAGGTLELQRSPGTTASHPTALVPPPPVGTKVLSEALLDLAGHVTTRGLGGGGPWGAGLDLLRRRPPLADDGPGGPQQRRGEAVGDALVRLAGSLGDGWLAVQGPPGSGKTHHGAAAVVALVAAGRRVGITAHSHAAAGNLLDAVCLEAERTGVSVRALQRCERGRELSAPGVRRATGNPEVREALALGEVDVVVGTAWLFARPELRDALDVLFVDEAGQLSLASTLAVSGSARGLVLLGDPQQLAQPSKGAHPDGADVSSLDHVLAGAATIAPEIGLFLDQSHRMHPDICRFVSTLAYDDRLLPAAGCEHRRVEDGPVVGGAGLRWWPVEHAGDRTRSVAEADAVAGLVGALVGRTVTDRGGHTVALTVADILVIAPYNAQVATLASVLPEGVRVGTVDRFQGREAPVVIYSLAASSAADVSRGIEFLLSTHRLNVAVSRAQALCVLVGSPALLQAPVRTPRQLRQVNALCRFVEQADEAGQAGEVVVPAPV